MKTKLTLIGLLTLCFSLLCGCGFHLHNIAQIPQPLRQIAIQSENPASPVTSELIASLKSLGVQVTPKAQYQLHISRISSTHSENALTNTSSAETFKFTQRVDVILTGPKGTLSKQSFSASIAKTVNRNQVLTPSTTQEAHESLPRDLVTQIYQWLGSDNVKRALYGNQTHSTQQTTQH